MRGTDCIDGTHRVEARFFHVDNWFYQVMALFPTDGGDETTARAASSSRSACRPRPVQLRK